MKTLRRDNPEYQKIKQEKHNYEDGMKRLFNNHPNWKCISRVMDVHNVPESEELVAEIKSKLQ